MSERASMSGLASRRSLESCDPPRGQTTKEQEEGRTGVYEKKERLFRTTFFGVGAAVLLFPSSLSVFTASLSYETNRADHFLIINNFLATRLRLFMFFI